MHSEYLHDQLEYDVYIALPTFVHTLNSTGQNRLQSDVGGNANKTNDLFLLCFRFTTELVVTAGFA